MSKFKIFILASLIALPSAGESATWYVATTGSDNNSCIQAQNPSTPKKTIRAGMACAGSWALPGSGAGDTVLVGNGTYAEEIFWNDWPTGTSGNPFTLKAQNRGTCGDTFGGCNVHLLPTSGACAGLPCFNINIGDVGTALHVVIEGLHLNGTNNCCTQGSGIGAGHGLRIWGNRLNVQYVEIEHPMSSNIQNSGSDSTFAHIAINGCSRDKQYKNGAGHAVMYMSGSRILYDYITVAGPDCVNAELITYNGDVPGTTSDDQIWDHVLTNGVGIGMYTGARNMIRNSLIMNNTRCCGTSPQTSGAGAVLGYGCTDCKVVNNTIFNNVDYACIHINSVGNFNAVVKNNICYQNGSGILNEMAEGGGADISNNTGTDPRFISPTTSRTFYDRTASNFRLQVGSSAIDKGANVTSMGVMSDLIGMARPQGNNYDIGAYESAAGADTVPPDPPRNVTVR